MVDGHPPREILRGLCRRRTWRSCVGTTRSSTRLARTGSEFVDPEEIAPDLWGRLAPDVELHERSELPDAKVYRGPDEAKEFWRKTQQVFAEVRWEPREFIDLGHAVVVERRVSATGRGSDVSIEMDETDVFWSDLGERQSACAGLPLVGGGGRPMREEPNNAHPSTRVHSGSGVVSS
jgi:hypothetical protein